MTNESFEYRTKEGDRWDLLAWEFYGDASRFGPILSANSEIPFDTVIEAGITLYIPLLQVETAQQDVSLLPPWKR